MGYGLCASAYTPRDCVGSITPEYQRGYLVFSLEAKRSTCSRPNFCHILDPRSKYRPQFASTGPQLLTQSAPLFRAPLI